MHQETRTYDLPTGRLSLHLETCHPCWSFDRLNDVGARANPKRGFLIVSKVLGRHVPVDPTDMRAAMDSLADEIPAGLPEPILVVGMAETATALGQGVHARLEETHREIVYIQSTRQDGGKPLLATFEEGHSHATTHLLHEPTDPEVLDLVRRARSLVIVDDESSTGNTFVAVAEAIVKALPGLERVVTAVLTDWSAGAYLERMPVPAQRVSLLAGRLEWHPNDAVAGHVLHAGSNGHGTLPAQGAPARFGIRDSSHHGVQGAGNLPKWREKSVLVLGDGEFGYEALLTAESLADAGNTVRVQSITRSPALIWGALGDKAEFSDGYGSGAPCYLYNALTPRYDAILISTENEHDLAGEMRAQVRNATDVVQIRRTWP